MDLECVHTAFDSMFSCDQITQMNPWSVGSCYVRRNDTEAHRTTQVFCLRAHWIEAWENGASPWDQRWGMMSVINQSMKHHNDIVDEVNTSDDRVESDRSYVRRFCVCECECECECVCVCGMCVVCVCGCFAAGIGSITDMSPMKYSCSLSL